MTFERHAERVAAAAALLLAAHTPASAHGLVAGLGPFGSGVLHPVTAPAVLVALAALGLMLGQGASNTPDSTAQARAGLAAYATSLLAGLALQALLGGPAELDADRPLLFCATLSGGAVAAAWRLPSGVRLPLAVLTGLGTGLASPPTGMEGQKGLEGLAMLAGTALSTLALPAALCALVTRARHAWARVAVRVLGSWLAAAALLVLSLSLAPRQGAG